jgi:glycosyltransferase involved in cell wall biosynthesis
MVSQPDSALPALRVCYFGTYRAEYSRNQIMIEGLRRAGVEVVECHVPLWHSIEDRVQAASGGWLKPAFWSRFLRVYRMLLRRYRQVGGYDVLVVGYPGQADVFLARLLSWLARKPLAWDIFMSIYLIALERGLDRRSRLTITLLRLLEWAACRLPDRLILDTEAYAAWFSKTHGVPPQAFRLVPTGADDRVFQPCPDPAPAGPFKVLYYGTFIPNHGVEYIVEAARILQPNPSIQFELIGSGPELPRMRAMVEEYELQNVTFIDWLAQEELVRRACRADVCLGAFGTTPQSLMTVQNKIYEGLAMRKPVLNGDSPAVRQALAHGEHIYLCERANPAALAHAILALQEDPALRERLAHQGFDKFCQTFSIAQLGRLYAVHLRELANGYSRLSKST